MKEASFVFSRTMISWICTQITLFRDLSDETWNIIISEMDIVYQSEIFHQPIAFFFIIVIIVWNKFPFHWWLNKAGKDSSL